MKKSIRTTIQLFALAALAALCIYLCPRYTNPFKYDFEIGQPWGYGLVTAEFDFPIYKNDAQLQLEYQQVLQDYPSAVDDVGCKTVQLLDFRIA